MSFGDFSVARTLRFLATPALAGLVVAIGVLFWLNRAEGPLAEWIPRPATESYSDAVHKAAPAVVNIYTAQDVGRRHLPDDPFFDRFMEEPRRQRAFSSLGSGVIMTPNGHILTNHHVIEQAEAIAVVLANGDAHPAAIIGIDTETDLAVLRIAATDITAATIGQSRDLKVGDVVLAIGNPFGVGQTVTKGIVSATGRTELGINLFEDFIQTDAAINPGNSGGALINALGELVGINTAIFTRSGGSHGIGFAIPVDLAREVMTEIIEKGYVTRGWLGIEVQAMDRALAESFGLERPRGVLIAGILNGGPAARAGLQPGDVVVRLDGQRVDNAREALNAIARKRPGEPIAIEALREGETLQLEATVDQRPV